MSEVEQTQTAPAAVPEAKEAGGESAAPAVSETQVYEDLEKSILYQVEYYFSKENLKNDAYLKSKMNAQLYVSLDTVMQFKLLKKLTTDMELVKKVLRNSTKVELDETKDPVMIRPKVQIVPRATLILRELPKTVPKEEIQALFSNSDQILSLKPEVGDHWYILFTTEAEAKKAFEETRDKLIQGKPVKARVKSENLLRSFESDGSDSPSKAPTTLSAAASNYNPYQPFFPAGPGGAPQMLFGFPPFLAPHAAAHPPRPHGGSHYGGAQGGHAASGAYAQKARGNNQGNQQFQKAGGPYAQRAGAKKDETPLKKTGPPSRQSTPKLMPSDFPPLPNTTSSSSGYPADQPFRKYTKKQIVDVLNAIKGTDIQVPADLEPRLKACPALRDVPRTEVEQDA